MPKLFSIDSPRSTRLAVWSLTESEEDLALSFSALDETQQNRWAQLKTPLQRSAFWSLRHLMLDLGLDPLSVYYAPSGRPMLHSGGWLSLSHTAKYTALAWNTEVAVGVDIEAQRPQIWRIAHKFSPPESSSRGVQYRRAHGSLVCQGGLVQKRRCSGHFFFART